MSRIFFCLLLALCSCIPAFKEATSEELYLTRDGSTYTLHSSEKIERGSVGVRAASVESPYCAPKSCLPDSEGRVLLRLLEGAEYGLAVNLGRFEGVQRIRLVIVRVDEQEAIIRTLEN